jgi:hypothetical protein
MLCFARIAHWQVVVLSLVVVLVHLIAIISLTRMFDVDRFDQLVINFDIYGKRRSVFSQSSFKIGFNFKWFSLVSYDVLPELL